MGTTFPWQHSSAKAVHSITMGVPTRLKLNEIEMIRNLIRADYTI